MGTQIAADKTDDNPLAIQQRVPPEELLYWLALRLTPGLGPMRSIRLLREFRTPVAVFHASVSQLVAAGVPAAAARSIESGILFEAAIAEQEKVQAAGVQLIPLTDPMYPELLRSIADPPLVLYAKGQLELLSEAGFAIVGTRRPSHYGATMAERFARDAAQAGVIIVSGMARGIDTAAHRGALAVGGGTIAVFGCGVDELYPAENRKLKEQIQSEGLVLSEYPMGTPAYPQNFPARNRIVSGLSWGLLLVEGAQYSGSAITARLAIDQGRRLFALPGNITNPGSWGPNLMLKQGAEPAIHPNDIISSAPLSSRGSAVAEALTAQQDVYLQQLADLGPMQPVGRAVLAYLKVDALTQVDEIVSYLEHYSSSEVLAVLFELELRGIVKQFAGRNYSKVLS